MKLLPFHLLSLAILLADQLLKQFVGGLLPLCRPWRCESLELLPFLKLTLVRNYGAAFSFLNDAGGWQRWFLAAVSLGVSLFILAWLHRAGRQQPWLATGLSLILGGALGNLVDRVRDGYVTDFIVAHTAPWGNEWWGGWHFPAFNLADAAITLGAALLILDMLLPPRRPPPERRPR